jgi:hypothetical protein
MNRFTLLLIAILIIISSNGLAATSSESKTPSHVLKDLLHETNTKNEIDLMEKIHAFYNDEDNHTPLQFQQGSSQSFLNKYKQNNDYMNLLEEGAHAKLTALAKGDQHKEVVLREGISNVEKITELVNAIAFEIGTSTFIHIEAGLSLLGLGGGVAVGFSIEVGVIPKVVAVVENFLVSKFYLPKPDKKDTLSNTSLIHMVRSKG